MNIIWIILSVVAAYLIGAHSHGSLVWSAVLWGGCPPPRERKCRGYQYLQGAGKKKRAVLFYFLIF